MADSLFTDGQVGVLASAIGGAAVAIAAAIRWGVGRLVKALDIVAADSKQVREVVVELRAEVHEGRDDIAEIKAAVTGTPRPSAPRRRRVTTPVQGSPVHGHRRPPTDSDR